MGRLPELLNEWEVQLLVLLSFILQLFLFFTGGLRRRSRSWLLRVTIWIAYLGADMVAIYALGILSRDANAMDNGDDDASSLRLAHPLAFLWAPFLLIHLGGQDTITAFAIEDNKLWQRHLLNLLAQVTLALYVFWKSSSWHSTQVLVPGILLFAAGIIKYGERIAALRHGNLNNNLNSMDQQDLPDDGRCTIIRDALHLAPRIRMLFARRKTPQVADDPRMKIINRPPYDKDLSLLFKVMDVELGMVYSDLYTKAAVLRTKIGIVFRCISLSCTVAALVLFFFFFTNTYATTGGRRVDTVITYTLFIGGLIVDVCTVLRMVITSPWTWGWLRARGYRRMASIPLCLVSSRDTVSGWLGMTTRPLWSNTMGQYRFVRYDDDSQPWRSSPPPPPTCLERVMGIIRKLASREEEKKLFCLSKLLETKHVAVDDNVTGCLVAAVNDLLRPQPSGSGGGERHQPWECLGHLLLAATTQPKCSQDFVRFICWLHACTEVLLFEAAAVATGVSDADTAASADACRKLSRYMVYLVAVHPEGASLLQVVSTDPDEEYQRWERYSSISLKSRQHQIRMGCLLRLELEAAGANGNGGWGSSSSVNDSNRSLGSIMASSLPGPDKWQQTLEELKRMWAGLLVYAAANSRPEAHAAELARGGELLTFVWLLLSHHGLGDAFRVDLVRPRSKQQHAAPSSSSEFASGGSKTYYVFKNLPAVLTVVNNCCPQLIVSHPEPKANSSSTNTDSRSSSRRSLSI